MKNINLMLNQMESGLEQIGFTDLSVSDNNEKARECVTNTLVEIQEYVMQNNFRSVENEIAYFKRIRPGLAAKVSLISFMIQYQSFSILSEGLVKELILTRKEHFERIVCDNKNHFLLLNRNLANNDHIFFTRNQFQIPANYLGDLVLRNPKALTYHSLLLEVIETDRLIEGFLNKTPEKLNNSQIILKWAGSKRELIELMYSLYYLKVCNNVTIRDMTTAFERLFDIDLGDVYREFHAIKNRNEPTLFIDRLRDIIHDIIDKEGGYNPR